MMLIKSLRNSVGLKVDQLLGRFSSEDEIIYLALESASTRLNFEPVIFDRAINKAEKLVGEYHGKYLERFEILLDNIFEERRILERRMAGYGCSSSYG